MIEALETLPSIPLHLKRPGLISDRALAVWDWPEFGAHLARIALPQDPGAAISELTAWAARRVLVEDEAGFVYLHALTASTSLRTLLPLLDSQGQQRALGVLVQALLALELTHRGTAQALDSGIYDTVGLVDRAIEITNDHGIKFVEAVLREQAIQARPERVAAAWKMLESMAP